MTLHQPARQPERRLLVDQVRELIYEDLILSGAVPPGSVLPSEAEMCARYSVSRTTVRGSLQALQHAGLIAIRNGVGSVVLPRALTSLQDFEQLRSVEAFALRQGRALEPVNVRMGEEPAGEADASLLDVEPGDPIVVVEHAKALDATPIAWGIDRVPAAVASLATFRAQFRGSTLEVVRSRGAVGGSDAEFTAVAASELVAGHLGVAPGAPLVFLDQIMRRPDGEPVQWAQTWLLPEHFRFTMHRQVPPGA